MQIRKTPSQIYLHIYGLKTIKYCPLGFFYKDKSNAVCCAHAACFILSNKAELNTDRGIFHKSWFPVLDNVLT